MQKESRDPGAYVQRVRSDTRRYVEDLLAENEKLRRQLAANQDETCSLRRAAEQADASARLLREELDRERQERSALRDHLAEVEDESRSFSERYVHVEQQNNDLANLYVAGYRLHGTLERSEVLAAIQEIIINLVGCEELAIFETDVESAALRLIGSFGIDAEVFGRIALTPGAGIIGHVAASGEAYLMGGVERASRSPLDEHLSACIPLRVEDRVCGVIAMFRLLPQKEKGLGALDLEMLDLLSAQAGTALYCTELHARRELTRG
ncbi:MAG: GAF domain-containing protein [Acidobacteriota bacterium]